MRLADRPATGGTPASVIVTVQVRAEIAESTDGTQLSTDQLLRIADQPELWPAIIDRNGVPLALGRTRRNTRSRMTKHHLSPESGLRRRLPLSVRRALRRRCCTQIRAVL